MISKKKQRGDDKRNPSSLKRTVGSSNRTGSGDLARMEGGEENKEKFEGYFGDIEPASDTGRLKFIQFSNLFKNIRFLNFVYRGRSIQIEL